MLASTIDHRTDRVNANKNWNRRRSRILKAMKANTKGMLAIHPTRRNLTGLTRCNPNTITEPLYPTTHAVWPSYSDGEVIL